MKNLKILIVCIILISETYCQQTSRRGFSQTSKGFFTKAGIGARPSLTESGTQISRSRIQSSKCPKEARSIATEAFFSTKSSRPFTQKKFESRADASEIPRVKGSRFLEFARRHPGKIIGVVSGIGGSTAAYSKGKKYLEKSDVVFEIHKLNYAVGYYNPENKENKAHVYELLNKFIKEGIVNKKDRNGNTPLMIILKADYVSDEEKAPMLQLLLENGAHFKEKDKKRAINLALGLNENTESLHIAKLQFKPKLKTLAVILPFLNQSDIESLKKIYDSKVESLKEGLDKEEEKLQELQQEKKPYVGFFFNREKQNRESILNGLINSYKNRLAVAQEVQNITKESLEKLETIKPINNESTNPTFAIDLFKETDEIR